MTLTRPLHSFSTGQPSEYWVQVYCEGCDRWLAIQKSKLEGFTRCARCKGESLF